MSRRRFAVPLSEYICCEDEVVHAKNKSNQIWVVYKPTRKESGRLRNARPAKGRPPARPIVGTGREYAS